MERTLTHLYVASRADGNWQRVLRLLKRWQRNHRTRQQLAQLDDRQLADVGISHSDRAVELDKPFWR